MNPSLETVVEEFVKRKREGSLDMSQIRAEIKSEFKLGDDEVRAVCREISERELENNSARQKRISFRTSRRSSAILAGFWLLALIFLFVFNGKLFELSDGMFWLVLTGNLILFAKNLWGLREK